jgi:hypothetical protein
MRILFITIFFLSLIGCNKVSNNEIVKSIVSPDEKYIAYVFIRDMGATTKSSYQLSILKNGNKLSNNPGNIHITYGEFDVSWNTSEELIVEKKASGEVFKAEEKYKDVSIKYE